jgi:hypothetical protein
MTMHDGDVHAVDRVFLELANQRALGVLGPREHHHAARVSVEPVDRAHALGPAAPPVARFRPAGVSARGTALARGVCLGPREQSRQHFIERRLQVFSRGRPVPLLGVPQRGHQRRFDNHHDVPVTIEDVNIGLRRLDRTRVWKEVYDIAGLESPAAIQAHRAVDGNTPRSKDPFGL